MIPKKIHYCWFGGGELPELAQKCIASWHRCMPDYEYVLWDEDRFDVNVHPYTKEAYEVRKFAFVSDYVRLWVLCNEGGIYLDTDVEVFRSFDELLNYDAFAGFEGSKYLPIGTCVLASKAGGLWAREMLDYYENRHFFKNDGSFDMTTNVQFITAKMRMHGLVQDGKEQQYKDLHVFPIDYFSPRNTMGEYIRTENTFCDHHGMGSWSGQEQGWKARIGRLVDPKIMTRLIKMKRRLVG